MSRTVKVSASHRVTTPLSFIFWPLAIVRAPAGLVVSWARIGDAEKANRQVISTAGANILCLVNTIDLSPSNCKLTRSLNTRLLLQGHNGESSLLASRSKNFADDIS